MPQGRTGEIPAIPKLWCPLEAFTLSDKLRATRGGGFSAPTTCRIPWPFTHAPYLGEPTVESTMLAACVARTDEVPFPPRLMCV